MSPHHPTLVASSTRRGQTASISCPNLVVRRLALMTLLVGNPDAGRSIRAPSDMSTLVYILGVGRSGSSLIEDYLARRLNIPSFGELAYFPDRGYLFNETCSCGRPFHKCPYWKTIASGFSRSEVVRFAEIRWLFEATSKAPLTWILSPFYRTERRQYAEFSNKLLQMLSSRAKAPAFIDSSKFPGRAYSLARLAHVPILYVHVVRNPTAIAHAWGKRKRRPEHNPDCPLSQPDMDQYGFFSALFKWMAHTLFIALIRLRLPPQMYLKVRYEDFIVAPNEAVERVRAAIGMTLPINETAAPNASSSRPSFIHSVSGNPTRLTGFGAIKADTQWINDVPTWKRVIASILTWPFWWGR